MTTIYSIQNCGANGAAGIFQGNGAAATPLGPEGNGTPGQDSAKKTCTLNATNGQPGNPGFAAPPALDGGNGASPFFVTIKCVQFQGQVNVLSTGGDGGVGASGGVGGTGGAGGNAGLQSPACKTQYGDSVGGIGGQGGTGGNAGKGGNGANGGLITARFDPNGPNFLGDVLTSGGNGVSAGVPGAGGVGGTGGLNGDGKTNALPGGQGGGGEVATGGNGGNSGNVEQLSADPGYQFVLSISPIV